MDNKKKEKSEGEKLAEKLLSDKKNGGLRLSEEKIKKADKFCEGYKSFLNTAKTEREAVIEAVAQAEKAGFKPYEKGKKYDAGDKFYFVNRGKAIILTVMGKDGLEKGIRLAAAHIDSPRLDLKQNPLYEDKELCLFKTHYYGGIKKYQWTTVPMSLHGVVIKADGESVTVNIGEDKDDPVFCVTDILPHLADAQMKRPAPQLIKGEELNLLIGSRPFRDDAVSNKVKLNIMAILNEKYGIVEDDFVSAELEAVPAFKAQDVGFDRSMVGSYGQDDRVCAYTSLLALLEMEAPKRTSCCLLVDKEEIGSVGATGMQSHFFENSVAEVLDAMGQYSDLRLRKALKNSSMLSSDVSAGYDPAFAEAFEKKNSAYLGRGIVLNKFTGARGKSGSNDANAEYVARVRRIFDDHKVCFQTAELGKVDVGGGGTIAFIAALYGMEVIDSGVSVLSMHAPWEVTSKADVYEAKKAYKAFLLDA